MKKRAAPGQSFSPRPRDSLLRRTSAGLDPLTSAALDELRLDLRKQLKMTIVIVTHELASIHRIPTG
jgi:phospholipid/cholesterol/gamma-HCH transport system ATP-binding protein